MTATNIYNWFQLLIDEFNVQNFCNDCWYFIGAKPKDSEIAKIPEDKECCYHFYLNSIKVKTIDNESNFGDITRRKLEITFDAFIGKQSKPNIPFYNESGDISCSKYENVLSALEQCLICNDLNCYTSCLELDCGKLSFKDLSIEFACNTKMKNYDGVIFKGKLVSLY